MQRKLIVRVYLREGDRKLGDGKMLLDSLVRLLVQKLRVGGITVFRGVMGCGHSGVVYESDLAHMSARLPLVVEFFGEETRLRTEVLPRLVEMIDAEHIVFWTVESP